MSKKKIVLLVLIGLLLLIPAIWIAVRRYQLNKIHQDGVLIEEPKFGNERSGGRKDFHYQVSDMDWKDQILGDTGKTIEQRGDLLCCVCSVLSMADKNEKKTEYTPDKLNNILSEIDGYEEDGAVRGSVLKEIAENVKYHDRIDTRLQGEKLVRDQKSPDAVYDIVKVKKNGDDRWVVITGLSKDKKKYQCVDPKEESVTYLSDYGNRVYEWYTMGGFDSDVDMAKEGKDILAKRKTMEERMRLARRVGGVVLLIILSCIIGGKAERYRKRMRDGEIS